MNIIVYLRDNYINKNGKAPAYLQLHFKRKKVTVPAGVNVRPDEWDANKRLVKKKHPDADDLNMILKQSVSRANQILIKYRLMEKSLTPDQFKDEYRNPSSYIDFYFWMENEIRERKNADISANTAKDHMTTLNQVLKKFKPELTFSEIDSDFVERFVKHVRKTYPNIGTQYSKLKAFKSYLNIALKRGLIHENPFRNVKLKRGRANPEYLDEDELINLCSQYKQGGIIGTDQKILRHFLFACFTSLRISDLKSLTYEQIINDTIVKYPKKTGRLKQELVKIPLSKSARKLIIDENRFGLAGPVFTIFSEQFMNRRLKQIGKTIGIEKEITTKVARHTFATIFLKHHPGDVVTLQKLMGHSRIEQTLVYIHLGDDWKVERMRVFDKYI
jgi:site-specific recombinase XerD